MTAVTRTLLIAGALGWLGQEPVDEALRPRIPTQVGEHLLEEADIIIVGRCAAITPAAPGVTLLRFGVLERVHAAPSQVVRAGQDVHVLTYPGHFEAGAEELLFLKRYRGGQRFEILYRLGSRDEGFRPRVELARKTSELSRIRDAPRRLGALQAWLIGAVEGADPWMRTYAADELEYMAAIHPWAFRPDSMDALTAAADRSPDPLVAERVKTVADLVRKHFEGLSNPEEKGPSSP